MTDGAPAGTFILRDLMPDGTADVQELTVVGSQVFFVANVPGLGRELWKTDGTVAGAQLVKDIQPGSGGASLDDLVWQWAVLEPGVGPFLNDFALSHGLQIQLGQ